MQRARTYHAAGEGRDAPPAMRPGDAYVFQTWGEGACYHADPRPERGMCDGIGRVFCGPCACLSRSRDYRPPPSPARA